MSRLLNKYIIISFLTIMSLLCAESFAQTNYNMRVANGIKVNNNTIEFDVFIKNNATIFSLTSYQCVLSFTQMIINNGNLNFSYIAGTSEFINIPPVAAIGIMNNYGIYFLTFASTPPGEEIITSIEKRVGRFRLQNSNQFLGDGFNIWWSFSGEHRTILTGSDFSDITNRINHTNLVATTSFPLSVQIQNGWNLVSIPGLHPINQDVNTWWAGRDPNTQVYKFNGVYQAVSSVEPGKGYWMKNLGNRLYNTGDEWPSQGISTVPNNPIQGNSGWNIFGGYDNYALTSGIVTTPQGLQSGFVYGYSPTTGYFIANNLTPGFGYMVRLTGNGFINLPSAGDKSPKKKENYIRDDWGKIIITDNSSKSYILYSGSEKSDLSAYELPPIVSDEMFDIRFGSSKFVEDLSNGVHSIEMKGIDYPVKIRVENIENLEIQDESANKTNRVLKSNDEIIIYDKTINKLFVSLNVLPGDYSIKQNYPNPFNPSTTIEFSVPVDGLVRVKIYDLLGQEVRRLVDENYSKGNHFVVWNGKDDAGNLLTSGCYIYRMEAGDFSKSMKMILVK